MKNTKKHKKNLHNEEIYSIYISYNYIKSEVIKMKKKEIKKILVCVVAIVMLIFTIASSFAAEPQTQLRPGNNVNIDDNGDYQNIQDGVNNKINNKINNVLNKTTNKTMNNTENNNSTLPYTGAEYTGILSIAVCIIVAVYSYVKVKKYNV